MMDTAPIQPHNLDAEQELLGAVLINNDALRRIEPIVGTGDFFHEAHRRVFEAAQALVRRGEVANPVTLKGYFAADDLLQSVGGPSYLARLAAAATTVINAPDYARVVADLARRRELIQVGSDLQKRAQDPAVEDPAAEIAADAVNVLERMTAGAASVLTNGNLADEIADDLTRPVVRYSTGLPDLDESMGGGLYAGKMYGFAARMKTGKTTLLATISQNINADGVRHLFIAGESSPKEVQQKAIARFGRFSSLDFLTRDHPEMLMRVTREYRQQVPENVFYEAAAGLGLDGLRRMISAAIVRHKIKGVFLDYLQLVRGRGRNVSTAEHLDEVSQFMADISVKHGIFSVVAAQINQDKDASQGGIGNVRGGEGLKLACSQYYAMVKDEAQPERIWLNQQASRYTMHRDVGDPMTGGLRLHRNGTHFEEFSEPYGSRDAQPITAGSVRSGNRKGSEYAEGNRASW